MLTAWKQLFELDDKVLVGVASALRDLPPDTTSSIEGYAQVVREALLNVRVVVWLACYNGQKIQAIKCYRQATGCGLKDAKDIIDAGPVIERGWFMGRMTAAEAQALVNQYELLNFTVEPVR